MNELRRTRGRRGHGRRFRAGRSRNRISKMCSALGAAGPPARRMAVITHDYRGWAERAAFCPARRPGGGTDVAGREEAASETDSASRPAALLLSRESRSDALSSAHRPWEDHRASTGPACL